jgi:hypothetical protein
MIRQLLLAVVLAIQGTTAPAVSQSGVKLSGKVIRDDGQPSIGSRAPQVRLTGGSVTRVTTIGSDETFEFTNVEPGTYQLIAGPLIQMPSVTVVVADSDVSVQLRIPVVISVPGTVAVDGGGLRPRLQVLFSTIAPAAGAANAPLNVTATTAFTAQLPPGEYRVSTAGLPAGYSVRSITSGTTDLTSQTLKIAANDTPQIALTLAVSSPPPWVKVSGRVVVASGTPGTSLSMSSTTLAETLSAPLNPDGSFEIARALPGSYTVRVLPATPAAPVITLSVGNADLTNVRIALPATREITGHIVIEGEGPTPRTAGLSLEAVSAAVPPAAQASLPLGTVTVASAATATTTFAVQPDGTFKITLPEGERNVRVSPTSIPKGYIVKSIAYGATDALKNPIRVSPTDTADLKITFDTTQLTMVKVSGHVSGLGAAVPVGTVTLAGSSAIITDVNGTLSVLSSSGSYDTPLNPDGSFTFLKVIPGSYQARFSGPGINASAAVVVVDKDIAGIEISVPKDTPGRVVVEGGGPAPRMNLPLTMLAAAGAAPPAATTTLAITPQIDGGFRVALPIGDRHIGSPAGLPAGYSVKSIMYGSADLLKDPLKVTANDSADLVITLAVSGTASLYRVSGRVNGLKPEATKGARVVLAGGTIGAGHETSLLPDGSFVFEKLFPGSYSVRLSLSGLQAATSFSVVNKDVTGVTINYSRTYNVAAHVVVDGAPEGSAPPVVVFEAKRPDGQAVAPGSLGNGMTQLTLAEGANRVSVRSIPEGYQLKSLLYGTTDLSKDPLVMDGPVVWEIVARLAPAAR